MNSAKIVIMKSISLFVLLFAFVICVKAQPNCQKGNCQNGFGTATIPDQGLYTGYFKNGKFEGKGAFNYLDGSEYKGHWHNGQRQGKGKLVKPDGRIYIGSFNNHTPNGQGSLTIPRIGYYEGSFKDGYFHGLGTMQFEDGSFYEGNWKDGKRDGHGKMSFPDGYQLKGQWMAGIFQMPWEMDISSMDTASLPNCKLVVCETGMGKMYFPNGTIYYGAFENGTPKGLARVHFPSGKHYEGHWDNNAPNGIGVMNESNGHSKGAIWENGVPKRILFQKNGSNAKGIDIETGSSQNEVKIWAVIVGAAAYLHMPILNYTDNDAFHLYAFLKSPEGGALPDQQIALLIDEKATKPNISNAIQQIFWQADQNDVILFYFSGHGIKGAFLPIDFDGINHPFPHEELLQLIAASNAKHKLIIADACHSGSMIEFLPNQIDLSTFYDAFEQSTGGTALLMSSRKEEISLEDQSMQSGIFSHFMVKALKGAADHNHNNIVTIKELHEYVSARVMAYTKALQKPVIQGDYDPNMPVGYVRRP